MDKFLKNRLLIPPAKEGIYLDTATTGPFHQRVLKVLMAFYEYRHHHGGSLEDYKRWVKKANEVRQLVASLMGVKAEEIAFTPNASTGLNIGAHLIPLKAFHEVLVLEGSFPSGSYAFYNLSSRGIKVRSIKTKEGALSFEDLIKEVGERTKAISLSMVEYASGYRHDLYQLGEFCQEKGIYLLVDGTQGIGAMAIDVRRAKIPLLSFSPYKWLCAPLGLGVFYCQQELLKESQPQYVGWFGVKNPFLFEERPRLPETGERFEPGGLNYGAIMALGEAIKIHQEIGIEAIEGRILSLMDYLINKLIKLGVGMLGPYPPKHRSGILYLSLKPEEVMLVKGIFTKKGIRVNYGKDRIRIGIHYFNTRSDLDILVDSLEVLLRN